MGTAEAILEPLRAEPGRTAILCDIDGTLAPIAADPEAATVPLAAGELLRQLARRFRLVACVTGRPASFAREMVGVEELTYSGNHGLELLAPGEATPRLDPALGGRGEAAAGFVARLDWPPLERLGLRLEDKGPIQAIHWRLAPDPGAAQERAEAIAERAGEHGLIPHRGRMVLELRPVVEVDNGVASRRLIEDAGARRALFGGDDATDRDAFAALRELERAGELEASVCVAVASAEGPPEIQREADLVVAGPDGFLDLLRDL